MEESIADIGSLGIAVVVVYAGCFVAYMMANHWAAWTHAVLTWVNRQIENVDEAVEESQRVPVEVADDDDTEPDGYRL